MPPPSTHTHTGCMRNNVANYQNMTPEAKKKIYENALFVSNLATVTLGVVILALLVMNFVCIANIYLRCL